MLEHSKRPHLAKKKTPFRQENASSHVTSCNVKNPPTELELLCKGLELVEPRAGKRFAEKFCKRWPQSFFDLCRKQTHYRIDSKR